MDIVIIGAGLSGLAAGIYLQTAGHQVYLMESEEKVGGRCSSQWLHSDHGSFLADTGATVLTMPSLLEDLFHRAHYPSPHFDLLSPSYRAEYASGTSLFSYSDPELMSKHLASVYGQPVVSRYRNFRDWTHHIYESSFDNFMNEDYHAPISLLKNSELRSHLFSLFKLGAFNSLDSKVRSFFPEDSIRRLFTFQALYAGMSPRQARAVYSIISYMDSMLGVYYPSSPIDPSTPPSMGDIADHLAQAFQNCGGILLCSQRVSTIVTSPDSRNSLLSSPPRISSVITEDGTKVRCDCLIATCDLPRIDELLFSSAFQHHQTIKESVLSSPSLPHNILSLFMKRRAWKKAAKRKSIIPSRVRWSPSAFIIHGTIPRSCSENWDSQSHHTISFGDNWDRCFEEIISEGTLMSDPSILITRPAISVPARIGHSENYGDYEPLSILVPCPNLEKAPLAWEHISDPYAHEILHVLEQRGYTGISQELSIARIDTPISWKDQGHGAGSPFALAHTVAQTGPFRMKNNTVAGISNFFLAGSSTTPGVGLPTVLLSGTLSAQQILDKEEHL